MSLGVNLLAVLVEQAAKALGPEDFDIEIPGDAPPPQGRCAVRHGASARRSGGARPRCRLAENSVRVRDGHTGARKAGTVGFATLRGGSVVGDHSVILAGTGERVRAFPTMPRTAPSRARRGQGSTLGARQEGRALLDARRSRPGAA